VVPVGKQDVRTDPDEKDDHAYADASDGMGRALCDILPRKEQDRQHYQDEANRIKPRGSQPSGALDRHGSDEDDEWCNKG